MKIDTIWKNVAGYVSWAVLAVVIAVLQEISQEIEQGIAFDGWRMVHAAIGAIVPVLIVMLGAMKQPSVGHEPISARVDAHEDRLQVVDTVPAPRGAGQIPEVVGRA